MPDTYIYYTRTDRMVNIIPDIVMAQKVAAQAEAEVKSHHL